MLRVKEWYKNFENAASRKLRRLDWVPVPIRMDGPGYVALVDHEHGAQHFAAWMAIVEIAAAQEWGSRGNLPRAIGDRPDDIAGICVSLARISRMPARIFEEAVPRLIQEIRWLEEVNAEANVLPIEPPRAAMPIRPPEPRREPAAAPAPPSRMMPPIRWKQDEVFCRFVTQYLATGAALIDEDFTPAFEFCWKTLDWEQKLGRMKALEGHMAEYQGEPRFVPKPLAFLEKEWKRPVRPPVKGAAVSKQAAIEDSWGGARAPKS